MTIALLPIENCTIFPVFIQAVSTMFIAGLPDWPFLGQISEIWPGFKLVA